MTLCESFPGLLCYFPVRIHRTHIMWQLGAVPRATPGLSVALRQEAHVPTRPHPFPTRRRRSQPDTAPPEAYGLDAVLTQHTHKPQPAVPPSVPLQKSCIVRAPRRAARQEHSHAE